MRAPLWLHAGHWKAAAEAVATIESWRRVPAPPALVGGAPLPLVGGAGAWARVGGLGGGGGGGGGAGAPPPPPPPGPAGGPLPGPPMEANRQPRSNGTPVCTNVVYSRRRALHRTIGGMRAIRGPCRE